MMEMNHEVLPSWELPEKTVEKSHAVIFFVPFLPS
jgi:hypothetical protein